MASGLIDIDQHPGGARVQEAGPPGAGTRELNVQLYRRIGYYPCIRAGPSGWDNSDLDHLTPSKRWTLPYLCDNFAGIATHIEASVS